MSRADAPLPTLRHLLARAHLRLILFAVLLATASLVLSGGLVIRNYAQRNLELVARTVAYTVEPAVVFEDRGAIRDGVISVAAGRGVERVEVRDPQGRLLAAWRNPSTGTLAALSRAANGWLWPAPAVDQVHRGTSHIAEVRIYGNSEGILRYGLAGSIIALSCLGLTVLASRILARRLQDDVVEPLAAVAEVAHAVRRERAFERRVPACGIAEIDRFGRDFNSLLAELQGWHAGLTSENRKLAWRASHDGLTGLGNRQLFESVAGEAIAAARRSGQAFALLYFDIDRFKAINDRHGHESGDAALVTVADRLRGAIRQRDLAFRLGGDEFAVLLAPVQDVSHVVLVLNRIRADMARPLQLPAGVVAQIRLSVGVALFPDHGETIEELLRRADKDMYRDKRDGSEGRVETNV